MDSMSVLSMIIVTVLVVYSWLNVVLADNRTLRIIWAVSASISTGCLGFIVWTNFMEVAR